MKLVDLPAAIVVFGMNGCPACEAYLPIFREVAARWPQVPAFAFDAADERWQGPADFYKVVETPTTLLISYGAIKRRSAGAGSRADVEKLFRHAAGAGADGAG